MKGNKNIKWLIRKLKLVLFLLFFSAVGVFAQRTATRTIPDTNGGLLIGVNIVITGTSTGAVTDPGGLYSIDVPQSETILVYTYICSLPQEFSLKLKFIVT